jgi:hypothetical protein
MALILTKKVAPPKPASAAEAPAPQAAQQPVQQAPAQQPAAQPQPSGKPLSFLKRGAAAQQEFAKVEMKAELAAKGGNLFRFWVPKNGEAIITFLDGNLINGILENPFTYEHQVNMNDSWNNHFICTQEEEPCPICEGGANSSYVAYFTVIDHSEYVSKKDGQTKKDNLKLFVAKKDTVKLLQKQAAKRGGLRGCKFEVGRTGDKSPSVGSSFDFVEKLTEQQLTALYGPAKAGDLDRSKPCNYDKMLSDMYMTAKDLRKMGFGNAGSPVGSEAAPEDYAGKL